MQRSYILPASILIIIAILISLMDCSSFTNSPLSDILEMEQPLLGGGIDSFDSGEFRQLVKRLEYVEESDSNNSSDFTSVEPASVDKSVVPRFKVEAGFIICMGTFLIKLAWPLHDTLNLLFSTIVFALLVYKAQFYFGYVLSGFCPIRFNEIELGPNEEMASYSRWIMVLLTLLTEIIYFSLESRLHDSAKIVFASLLTLQMLYILGAIDYCANCLNSKQPARKQVSTDIYSSIANIRKIEKPFII